MLELVHGKFKAIKCKLKLLLLLRWSQKEEMITLRELKLEDLLCISESKIYLKIYLRKRKVFFYFKYILEVYPEVLILLCKKLLPRWQYI